MARDPFDDPEIEDNSEQDEEDQAQDIADDARGLRSDPSEDSERGGSSDRGEVAPADEPDLVERMTGMVRSGHIDNDAFAGEPQMDDEEDLLGETETQDDALDTLDRIEDSDDVL